MRRFTRYTLIIISLLWLSALVSPIAISGHVSAAGIGGGQCVKTKNNDCKDNGGGNGGGGGGSGISGSNTPADQAACAGLNQLGGTGCDGNAGQSAIGNVANRVVKIISYIAGIIAIIMVIVAGVKYTTSGGDAQKVGSAKTSLVYALVGLAVAALAQLLVHIVLSNT